MWEDKKPARTRMLIRLCCGFLILGLAACNLPGTGADDPEPTVTGGESQDVELGQQEQALKKGECPKVDSQYELLIDHEVVLNSGDVGDVSFHFELEEDQSDLFLWIRSDGSVETARLSFATINVSGWHTTPSKECPINYIQGSWMLTADITGTCKKGVVTLKVEEHFKKHELTGSCGDPISVPGLSSAPELTLTFDLSEPESGDGIISGSSGDPLFALYWYQLRPVPDQD